MLRPNAPSPLKDEAKAFTEPSLYNTLSQPGNAKFKFEHLKLFDQYLKRKLHFLGLFLTNMCRYPEIPAETVSRIKSGMIIGGYFSSKYCLRFQRYALENLWVFLFVWLFK